MTPEVTRLRIAMTFFFVLWVGQAMLVQWELHDLKDAMSTKSVVAESIGLKNAAGNIVALLSSASDGRPHVSLFDGQKKLRLSIGLRQNGEPSLSLIDPEQGERAVLSLNDQQVPSLTMFDEAKLPRALFALDASRAGTLLLSGGKGGFRLSPAEGKLTWNPIEGPVQDLPFQR